MHLHHTCQKNSSLLGYSLVQRLESLDDCQDIIATGGVDASAVLFDRASGEILCTLTGHSKRVSCSPFYLNLPIC